LDEQADDLIYNVRPKVREQNSDRPADAKPTEAECIKAMQMVMKP
jgi:hypothetical protein